MKRIHLATWMAAIGLVLAVFAGAEASSTRTSSTAGVSSSVNLGVGVFHGRSHSTPCQKTARNAKTACRNDVRDDYYTQLGNCLNFGESDDREECMDEAAEIKFEELALCRDRFEARMDLCEDLDEDRYDPDIDPADFLTPAEIAANPNPWFPLVPGNTWIYENEDETITVVVTGDTIEIDGIECIVVNDVVTEDGEVIEDTDDFYTQDLNGNLWYMGEVAKNFEDGRLTDLDGSWIHGEDFAKAGVLLYVVPPPGQVYRQEFLLREAEDVAEVISITANESSEFVDCDNDCLQTLEYSPLEPDAAEYKYYVYGIGLILEVDPETGDRTELVDFSNVPVN